MLGEKLHKTQKEVLEMGTDEFYNWMAYDMLKDGKFRKKVELERSKTMDNEARSMAIKAMFASLGGTK